MRLAVFAFVAVICLDAPAKADPIVTISSRGQHIRAVMLKPAVAKGSVILLAGGNGRLDITATGQITQLQQNELVRTRAAYEAKGYITLVPDLAPDMKVGATGVLSGYRSSLNYARDIGAMVLFLRKLSAKRVTVIGTSRGSIGAANAVAKLTGKARPNLAVYTSAYLKLDCSDLNLWCITNHDAKLLNVPSIVMWHVKDACPDTPPSKVPAFVKWWQAGTHLKLGLKSFVGGLRPQSGPCDALAPHGFWGLDASVVSATTAWIASVP